MHSRFTRMIASGINMKLVVRSYREVLYVERQKFECVYYYVNSSNEIYV